MDYLNDKLENRAKIIKPDDGEHLVLDNVSTNLMLTSEHTNDQLGIYYITLGAGAVGAKPHYHRFMDETFMVREGIVTVQVGEEEHKLQKGDIVYVPRFTPHGFKNDQQSEAKVTLIFNPAAKREGFMRGLKQVLSSAPVNPDDFLKLYNKYDSYPLDTNQMIPR